MQYPVHARHLPDNLHAVGTAACYESMGHSIALNKNDGGHPTIDSEAIESIMLDEGVRRSESITNISTKASTGALLTDEGDDNLSLPSSSQHTHFGINTRNIDVATNGSTVVVNMPVDA